MGLSVFAIISLVFRIGFFVGLLYRFKETSVVWYKYLAGAIGAFIVADIVQIILSAVTNEPWSWYVPSLISIFASLICTMVILKLLMVWIESVRSSVGVSEGKLGLADRACRILRIAYPILAAITAAFVILSFFSLSFAVTVTGLAGILNALAILVQMGMEIWLWLDYNASSGSERKKVQIARLAALTGCDAIAVLLAGYSGIGSTILWWIWAGILLWPGALVGYEEVPLSLGQGPLPTQGAYSYPTNPTPAYTQPEMYDQKLSQPMQTVPESPITHTAFPEPQYPPSSQAAYR